MTNYSNGHTAPAGNGKHQARTQGGSQRDQIIDLVINKLHWSLWCFDTKAYVSFYVKGHQETHPLASERVSQRLRVRPGTS